MKKLLLHICCAPDGAYIPDLLNTDYDVTCFFYNPNIFPKEEYDKRANEMQKLADAKKYKLIISDYDEREFLDFAEELFYLPEKSNRCDLCFYLRMEKTAKFASSNNFDIFSTVLTVSPHKPIDKVNNAGKKAGEKYRVEYLPSDYKKRDGYKISVEETQKYGIYRQDYCGCQSSFNYREMFKEACKMNEITFFTGDKIGIFDIQSVKKYISRNEEKTTFMFYNVEPTTAVFKEGYNEKIFVEPLENLSWRKKIFEKKGIKINEKKLSSVANRDIFMDPF